MITIIFVRYLSPVIYLVMLFCMHRIELICVTLLCEVNALSSKVYIRALLYIRSIYKKVQYIARWVSVEGKFSGNFTLIHYAPLICLSITLENYSESNIVKPAKQSTVLYVSTYFFAKFKLKIIYLMYKNNFWLKLVICLTRKKNIHQR